MSDLPSWPDENAWADALHEPAASNERLCRLVLAADKIVEYVDKIGLVKYAGHKRLEALLEAYQIARQGS